MRALVLMALITLGFFGPAQAQSPPPLDYRSVSLGMTMEEFQAVILARNAGEPRALAEPSCILNDWGRPDPDQYECEDPQDTAQYLFSQDDQQAWRLRRILVPGTIEDFAPFVEGMDRKFGGSTSRTAVRGGVRWARGRQSVTVKGPPCNERLRTVIYPGTCAVYVDHDLQSRFDVQRRENQQRDF